MYSRNDSMPIYIYDLPYPERKSLCMLLDMNNTWEHLGGVFMKFDVTTLHQFRQATVRNNSPTDELLTLWGTQNHTVLELFILLSRMQHYQAMMVLKPYVDSKYHRLIYEGEENFSRMLTKTEDMKIRNGAFPLRDNVDKLNFNININQSDSKEKLVKLKPAPINETHEESQNNNNVKYDASNLKKVSDDDMDLAEGLIPKIPYEELKHATDDWAENNLLGKGGFGTVFKGTWKNTQVAIKRLDIPKGDEMMVVLETNRKQSIREFKYLNRIRHDNILPLYGYSLGGPHDCLVYQYMSNGSLEDKLLCRDGSKALSWPLRHAISSGVAKGLQYLHTIGDKPLIHGDIKSANILLDPHFVPKIGDFGLAREGPPEQYTHIKVSRVHGTRPYLPDEFIRSKKLSTKVDVFGFGIVLFEIATGLRAYDEFRAHKYLKDHIESFQDERIIEVRDQKGGQDEGNIFGLLVSLGRKCVSVKPKDRPEMVAAWQQLTSSYLEPHTSIPRSGRKIMIQRRSLVEKPRERSLELPLLSEATSTSSYDQKIENCSTEAVQQRSHSSTNNSQPNKDNVDLPLISFLCSQNDSASS